MTTRPFPWRGLGQHLLSTLRLNFRSRAPLVYGYLVPVFFLLAFGSVFRSGSPPLLHEMGQLLTITVLGGTCFGLPTAMVAERDRGVWRRYRLLPASARALVLSTTVARALLVGAAAMLQLALAWSVYRTPWPAHPGQFAVAFGAVCVAFLGVGLVIAMLADNVPAVQAIGQCVFLPMIIIGGVGVPLRSLPDWAQRVAGFLPGRYAVEALDACILPEGGGLGTAKFALGALGVIGAAAFVAGFGLFRWDVGPRPLGGAARGWIGLALGAWVAVGLAAEQGRARPKPAVVAKAGVAVPPMAAVPAEPWRGVTEAEVAAVSFEGLTPDEGYYVPVARSLVGLPAEPRSRIGSIEDALAYWPPGRAGPLDQRVRDLLSVCAVADLVQDENEGEIAFVVFAQIRDVIPSAPVLEKVLAWVIGHPGEGTVRVDVSEFGIEKAPDAGAVRDRCAAYARKLLWRLRHPEAAPN